MLALQGTILTIGWVIVWFLVLGGAVWQIVRGRSGAGACLGGAAIFGLATHLCGAGVVGVLTGPVAAMAGPRVLLTVQGILYGCAHALVLLLVILGVVVQRPARE